jgi:uncharacterized membrane protein YbhN (UPF0104 family)
MLSSAWVKLALSLLLLAVLFLRTDLSDLGNAVREARPGWVVAAFIGYVLSQVVSAARWMMLARPVGFDQSFGHFFGAYFAGLYMNLFAPSTVAGDIGRALFVARPNKRKTLAFTSVLADRGLGFVVLVFIGAIAILAQPAYRLPLPLYYSAWVVPPATLIGWLYGPTLLVRVLGPANRWRRLVERDLEAYWKDSRLLVSTSVIAALMHVMQIEAQVLLAWALGIDVPRGFFYIFVPVVNILGMLPVTFNGIGIREGGYVFFLAGLGIARHSALALGLLSSGVVLATGVGGGIVFALWKPQLPILPAAAGQESLLSDDVDT